MRLLRTPALVTAALLVLPALALLIYTLELRIQAQFIQRVEISLHGQSNGLTGLDQAVKDHADFLWRSPALREQLERPEQQVSLPAFYIDKHEVTQRNYRKFIGWLSLQQVDPAEFAHVTEPANYTYNNPHRDHKILGRLDISATGISFYAAYAYCQAANGKLPSVEQWTAAAAGKEGRSYPWGEEFVGDSWRYNDPLLNMAAPHKNRIGNATPLGVFDLGAGVSEWTLDFTEDGRVVQKGGNNYNRPFSIQALNFIERPAPAEFSSKYNGFRCVYPARFANNRKGERIRALPWQGQSEVVMIPAGDYPLGVSEKNYTPKLLSYVDRTNPQIVKSFLSIPLADNSSTFAISKYEISRAEYQQFLRDPMARLGFYANKNEPRFHSYIPAGWEEQKQDAGLPVVGVDWWSAYAYAKWAGGRLPSEEEWLRAFGDAAKNPYPWGSEYDAGFAHVRDLQTRAFPESPVSAQSDSKDLTPAGVTSLGGNVSEWTNSLAFYGNGVNMIVKGGNYKFPGELGSHYSYYAKIPPNHRSELIGIRVVF